MGRKALESLAEEMDEKTADRFADYYESAITYSNVVGNVYTGSLYLSLISLIEQSEKLAAGSRIGLFSYGSGAVAELLTGTIQDQYLNALNKESVIQHFNKRESLTIEQYEEIYNELIPKDDKKSIIPDSTREEGFYLAEVDAHRRYYKYRNK